MMEMSEKFGDCAYALLSPPDYMVRELYEHLEMLKVKWKEN